MTDLEMPWRDGNPDGYILVEETSDHAVTVHEGVIGSNHGYLVLTLWKRAFSGAHRWSKHSRSDITRSRVWRLWEIGATRGWFE